MSAELNSLLQQAIAHQKAGRFAEAGQICRQVLQQKPHNAVALYCLGIIADLQGNLSEAAGYLERTLAVNPERAEVHRRLADIFYRLGTVERAIAAYQRAVAIEPGDIESHYTLGNVFWHRGDAAQAALHYQATIAHQPDYAEAYTNLGLALAAQGKLDEAIAALETSLAIEPTSAETLYQLGELLKKCNCLDLALAKYQQAIALKSDYADAYSASGVILVRQNKIETAISHFELALRYQPNHAIANRYWHLALPSFYESEKQIDFWRKRFEEGLQAYIDRAALDTPVEKANLLQGLRCDPNLYLAYQGKNDLELQHRYSEFLHRILAEHYPQWVQQLEMPPLSQEGKIRIGYVSPHLKNHIGAKWALGWLRYRDRQAFEVYSYFTAKQPDRTTRQFQRESDRFRHIYGDIASICAQIEADKLHILVFTDVGMSAQTEMLAALRLAPVQCACWGHPVTSGSSQIDYYLSSDLMEPENAQSHYSEILVRLPKLGFCYPKPEFPAARKSRMDFQLPEQAVLYLSCQTLQQYLPQYDSIFPQIAQQVPNARFVFALGQNDDCLLEQFQQRLQRAFADCDLDSNEFCIFLPPLNSVDFANLCLLSDVYLDTPSWSGENTTLKAIAYGLPIVTLPGEFRRGRHSYAMLKILEVEDTIASSETEYIEIAGKLGREPDWQHQIVTSMQERCDRLYDDKICVQALEDFYKSAVRARSFKHLLANAIALHQAGRFAEAEIGYSQILQQQPKHVTALYLLGTVVCQMGQYENGVAYIQSALAIDPNNRDAYFNLGNAFRECGRLDEAIAQFQKAIDLDPDSAEAHKALGISLLLAGDLERGFAAYEWRWQSREFQDRNSLPAFSQPPWDGSDLQGKTILLYPEQGAGDQIQFIRYASLVEQRGGKVIYACHPALMRLFATVTGIDRLVAAGEDFPAFDVYAPLLSLPHLFGTTADTIPDQIPYLSVPSDIASAVEQDLSKGEAELKVGIVWASKSNRETSAARSCPLQSFLQLLDIPNASFFSLQKEVSEADAAILKTCAGNLKDLSSYLGDFADTAAIIDRLDLVVTVDTAVAHLAGAMGKTVWILLPFAPDWRWMLEREDSPWYPTACLFRQRQPGDWAGVMGRVEAALGERVILNEKMSVRQSGEGMEHGEAHLLDKLLSEASSHQQAGRLAEAIASYHEVIACRPHLAEVYNNLGVLYKESENSEAAIANYQKAIELKPDFTEAYNNLGLALSERGDLAAAIANYQKAVALDPNYADIHKDLGMCLLLAGELERGFGEYEWRWQSDAFKTVNPLPSFAYPLWDGSDLAGKTILLYPEQGLGDRIQFIRYASLVRQRGGRVIYPSCSPLARLFATVPAIDRLLSPGDTIPPFDVYIPLMSLPHIFGTTFASIPTEIPYLFSSPLEGEEAERFELETDRSYKVGLVWACNRSNTTAERRSCPLAFFQKLLDIPDIQFYSLQKDASPEDWELLRSYSHRIVDLSDRLGDFADTAAIIDRLDLVITIDTAVAHLAGAMGKSVWVLLSSTPDWRWMLEREDSPWYPTMRLFRQQYPGDWEGIINRVRSALRERMGEITAIASGEKAEGDSLDTLLQEVIAHHQAGRFAEAEENCLQILDRRSEHFTALHLLGTIACQTGRFELGIARIQAALKIDPSCTDAYFNLGNALWENGNLEEATRQYERVISLKPDRPNVYNYLGRVLHQQGRIESAIANYQKALELQPDNSEVHQNLSLTLLLAGNLERGFAEYEWRRHSPDYKSLPRSHTRSPWDGSDLQGKNILVYLEQGVGDQIQFIRYASLLKARGANVIYTCPPELARLFSTCRDIDCLPTTVETIPDFDVWVPLLSLPHILGTTLGTIPARIPYLFPPTERENSSQNLQLQDTRINVGLVWSSKSNHKTSSQRSCALDRLLPLLAIPEANFYSLQKELSDRERDILCQHRLTDLQSHLHDFADTAAIIDRLDLVITIDTAVAHLAGAIGKPVWVLLPFVPDWRWLLEREDSPWYPTARLFRQQHPGDWEGVVARVAKALREKIAMHGISQITGNRDGGENEETYYILGVSLYARGDLEAAIANFQKALTIKQDFAEAYYNLGVLFDLRGDREAAIANYQQALSLKLDYAEAYYNLGVIFKKCGDLDAAIANFQKAIESKPDYVEAYTKCGDSFADRNGIEEAIHAYRQALVYQPDNAIARRMTRLILPAFYESEAEIPLWQQRFAEGLQALVDEASLETEMERTKVLGIFEKGTTFYLAYQGKNILKLQCRYAQLLHRAMTAQYPQWVKQLEMPPLSPGGKIRIGYVSPLLKYHNGSRWALGWLTHRDRNAFEVYSYFTGKEPDFMTQRFQQESDVFRHIDGNLTEICQRIHADRLHILVFTDIGMLPQTDMLASLRLAPVQCNCWGHPVTSGSPNIDYYLSSDLMEPDDAPSHYSEQLVRLPKLGFCYPKPELPTARKTRADYHLPETATIYLSCQSLYKYLPQYDDIFVEIAMRLPAARFAFISHHLSDRITAQFRQRLHKAFARADLDAEQYCTILPRQVKTDDYLNLLLVSDIYLDTSGWSGGNTTLEAIACGLPVVTLPGEFMRGRHSYAMLKILGMEATIADTEAAYVDIAVRLGEDLPWRQHVKQTMGENHDRLYDDTTCVRALEAFYKSVVHLPNLDELRKMAIAHHQANRFAEAERLYGQILEYQPDNAIVLHLLGTLACQSGQLELGIARIQKALEIDPNYVDANFNLGNALRETGDLESALQQYRKVISLNPRHLDAHTSLGQVLCAQNEFQAAIAHYQSAIAIVPDCAEFFHHLGVALSRNRNSDEAIANFQKAIARNPSYAEAYYDLAVTSYERGDLEGAIASYRKLIPIAPNRVEIYNNLGVALDRSGNSDEAIANYQQAIEINPTHAETYNNLGLTLYKRGEFDEAIGNYYRAIDLKPSLVEAYNNLGLALFEKCELGDAIDNYQKIIALDPNYEDARFNLSMALLGTGNFERGFIEYEWRFRGANPLPLPSIAQPQWDGSDLQGKTILIQAEQGLGDQIQFVRYASLVQQRGGQIVLACDRLLLELFHTAAGIDRLVSFSDTLPTFDVWIPLLSLPRVLGTTLETIPARVPYLFSSQSSAIGGQLDGEKAESSGLKADHSLKVGLVWSSKPNHPTSAKRSCPLDRFLRLLEIPNIHFYSLQKEASDTDRELLGQQEGRVTDLRHRLHDFAATAAIIDKLDLVVTIDTAVAHLAGAMGKPVWVLLPFSPDWRWLLEREDSPWYPTMRLFRQQQIGNWDDVLMRVGQALETFCIEDSPVPCSSAEENRQTDFPIDTAVSPEACLKTGFLLVEQGKNDAAIASYRQAIQLKPDFAEAYNNLGNAFLASNDFATAIENYRQAIALKPDFAEAYLNLGSALSQQNDLEAAICNYREAIALKPDFAEAYSNCGLALQNQDRFDEAIAHFQKAIALKPEFANSYSGLGSSLLWLSKVRAAIETFQTAINLNPDFADAHFGLGLALLTDGDLVRGFAEYEWRFRTSSPTQSSTLMQPLWDGSDLNGRTILISAEQGFGDTIQFIRYAPLLQARGGSVLFHCPPAMWRLFSAVTGIDRLIPKEEPLPEFDVCIPLMSIPYILGTDSNSIPDRVPYLYPPDNFEHRLEKSSGDLLQVGLVWASKQNHRTARMRSCPLTILQKLLDIPGIQFYSLQKEVTTEDLKLLGQYADRIENLSDRMGDFADTAGFIAQLDLVITVDTAVAHLAGAMGKTVWLLLSFAPDWRWMREREDSPWYPTMRLFRRKQLRDWEEVIARAIAELQVLVAEEKHPSTKPEIVLPQNPKVRLGIAWSMSLTSGWGIFGMNLTLQLLQSQEFKPFLVYPPAFEDGLMNPLHRSLLQSVVAEQQDFQKVVAANPTNQIQLDIPVMHSLSNRFTDFRSERVIGKKNLGFIFFEDTYLTSLKISAAQAYDAILAGSTWNASILKARGITNVYPILQGIDPTIFHPAPRSHLYGDRFVIFSGGKLEYRKSQDIVIAAFKVFRARHPDALLIAAWHNFWPQYMLGIEQTGNVAGLPAVGQNKQIQIRPWLVENGLPEDSFIDIGPIPNHLTPQIIREVDVAVFPNRCEGGTNLVAMECFACGIPVILSANTGHLDLIGERHCYPLQVQRPVNPHPYFAGTEGWGESDVGEVVEVLERIYGDREEAKRKGQAAAIFMQDLTWEKQMKQLLQVIKPII